MPNEHATHGTIATIATIAAKYCGPPQSANGGYTAGLLAKLIDGPCSVTLRAPPPLERALQLSRSEDGIVSLHDRKTLLADARPTTIDLALPEPVSFAQAERATLSYPGSHPHPYPGCFVCGPDRPHGDGLALYPGPVEGRSVVASPWVPTSELCSDGNLVDDKFIWAALDCPGLFGYSMFVPEMPPVLLGRLAAEIKSRPERDARYVVVGWNIGREGRRIECGSMLLDATGGDCLAFAHSTWVALKQPLVQP
ncbi:MAG TPA: hypothetical protein VFG30_41140 [Polyangiales bacterium]|nr:hypothetical protein [Polyangiales bacterium]